MAKYLVVAHQTIARRELLGRLRTIAAKDAAAWFTVLVPATEPSHLLVWEEGDAQEIAHHKVREARRVFKEAMLHVTRIAIGDASPAKAIADEFSAHPHTIYDSVILCTLPPGVSRWLGLNVVEETAARLKLPIEHIVAGDVYDSVLEELDEIAPL